MAFRTVLLVTSLTVANFATAEPNPPTAWRFNAETTKQQLTLFPGKRDRVSARNLCGTFSPTAPIAAAASKRSQETWRFPEKEELQLALADGLADAGKNPSFGNLLKLMRYVFVLDPKGVVFDIAEGKILAESDKVSDPRAAVVCVKDPQETRLFRSPSTNQEFLMLPGRYLGTETQSACTNAGSDWRLPEDVELASAASDGMTDPQRNPSFGSLIRAFGVAWANTGISTDSTCFTSSFGEKVSYEYCAARHPLICIRP